MLILPLAFEAKIGSKESGNRQNLSYARGLLHHKAHKTDQDQIERYDVVEYAGIHKDQDPSDDRKNRDCIG